MERVPPARAEARRSREREPSNTLAAAPRFAIVGTPRSGNMWLRRLLVSLLDLRELSADTPAAVPWRELPERCVLQLHWRGDDALLALLEEHSITPVVIARHPLDVLVSILHFAQREPRTARWLNADGGTEAELLGATPCSKAFLEYATGERARALLGLTIEWSRSATLGALVRYERLVSEPEAEVGRLLEQLGFEPFMPPAAALEENRFEALRSQVDNEHFWHGQPGLWHRLLPAARAGVIADAHDAYFGELGYALDPDPELDEETAERQWRALSGTDEVRATKDEPQGLDPRLASYINLASTADEEFVEQLYLRVLRRPVDSDARARALAKLGDGTLSRATLLHELSSSAEGRQVRLLDDQIAFARWARTNGARPRLLRAPPESDESAIAIPWALARYRAEARVLDVGYAFAEPAYLAALVAATPDEPVGVDLASQTVPGLRATRADVRQMPFDDGAFEVVFCLSILHHVGYDNRVYGLEPEHDPDGPQDALRELRRVLAGHGRLLVTVPCGETRDYGWFAQHDVGEWRGLFEAADFFVFEEEVYELFPDGWRSQPDFDPAGVRYAERGPGASAVLCAELRPGRLRQRLRRAVSRTRATLSGNDYRPG